METGIGFDNLFSFPTFRLSAILIRRCLLSTGKCNDSYSLVRIALALKDAFKVDSINDLPIVFNIAWYEQKAVIVLLALLYLGVQNIHTGPTLPAFFTPDILKVLKEKFGIGTISTVENDIATLINNEK